MGAHHEFGLSLGEVMSKYHQTLSCRSEEFPIVTQWSNRELEALVSEGIVRYRAAAAAAERAHNHCRRFMGAGDEAKYSIRLEEYRQARAICEAERVALSQLIDQLGYIPVVPTSA